MNDELYTAYEGLTDERNTWAFELKRGIWNEPFVLQQYRLNRNSNLWRATREVEKLCEYVLFLEGAKTMSESYVMHCDHCNADITLQDADNLYCMRVIEEYRRPSPHPSVESPKELDRHYNFCNLNHLSEWIKERNNHE